MKPILYPKAIWHPLLGHSYQGTLEQRNTVVLHITEGTTAAGTMAWFAQSKAPNRLSAHFVIDRDGTVYQLLGIQDTGFHASQANSHSIGIEHVAVTHTLLATDAQYKASAELVYWLCTMMKVAVDRSHVRTHNEASPADGHTLCCTGALDPDKVVAMAQGLTGL